MSNAVKPTIKKVTKHHLALHSIVALKGAEITNLTLAMVLIIHLKIKPLSYGGEERGEDNKNRIAYAVDVADKNISI